MPSEMERVVILVTPAEHDILRQLADGRPLSSWIKRQVLDKDKISAEAPQPGKKEGDGSGDRPQLPVRNLPVGGRRAVPSGRSARSGTAALRSRRTAPDAGSDAPSDAATVVPDDQRPDLNATETYYHTATSDWRTCMCVSCARRRADHDIPYGGVVKKEKKPWKKGRK